MAALIAYRQAQTAKTKLLLELYEKRLPVYNAVRQLVELQHDLEQVAAAVPVVETFLGQAEFLFDDEIALEVKFLHWKGAMLLTLAKRLDDPANPDPDYDLKSAKRLQTELWELREEVTALFKPYLQLEMRGARRRRNGAWKAVERHRRLLERRDVHPATDLDKSPPRA